jgi:hypothetical protein
VRRRLRLIDRKLPFAVRRGRKAHRCATHMVDGIECRAWDLGRLPLAHTAVIPAGAEHVEHLGSGPRYCEACAVTAGRRREASVNAARVYSIVAANFLAETDENGEARVVVETPEQRVPRLRVLARFGESPYTRRAAFRRSKLCVTCGATLLAPDAGHVVPTSNGDRLACAGNCFAAAMAEALR